VTGLLLAAPAFALDGWTEPYPGIRLVETVRPGPTRVWVAAIDTCAPGVSFRMTSPDDFGGASQVTSRFASTLGVQLATNGDFYDHDFGMNVGNGVSWEGRARVSAGRDRDTSGTFAVGRDRVEMFPTEMVFPRPEAWMREVVGGRWSLIRDGEGQYGIADGGFICSPGLRHPRTMVGQSEDGRTVFLAVGDGRGFGGSAGLTCDEAIDLLLEAGAWNAMGLDGGGSSTMVLDGAGVLNLPTDGRERSVLNHVGVYASGAGSAPHCGEHAAAPYPGPVGRVAPVGAPGRLTLSAPVRLVDTRQGSGGPVVGGADLLVDPALPTGATGVLLNLTTTESTAPGFLTTWPDGTAAPNASTLNWSAGEAVGNAVVVSLGGGGVRARPSATTHLVVDRQGWLGPTGLGFVPVAPERLQDTRSGAPLAAATVRRLVEPLAGPATLSVVAVDPQGAGFLTLWPCDEPLPPTSNLNFEAGEVAAASVTVDTSRGGVCAWSNVETDVVVDVTGVWTADGLAVQGVSPSRLLDTRTGEGRTRGRVKPGQVVEVDLGGLPGWPADGQGAALVLTVTQPTEPGFLQVWPCDQARPDTSASNFAPGQTVAVSALLGAGTTRSVCLSASASLHLVVDLQAVLAGAPVDPSATVGDYRSASGHAEELDVAGPAVTSSPTGCSTTPGGATPAAVVALLLGLGRKARQVTRTVGSSA
jgi:hypothetical protein